MANFKVGTVALEQGVTEVTLSGLAFGFVPTAVTVGVRQPSGGGGLVTAYVTGVPTSDGFSVALSAPAAAAGYYLDYVAFSESAAPTPTSATTLQVSYTDLKNEVSRFLGYDATALTTAQASEVDGYIQSGVRQFYYPPVTDGNGNAHEWSFLKLAGSLTTAAGVNAYTLPDGFGRVVGQLVYGDSEARQTVPVIPYGEILKMQSAHPEMLARPRFAAVIAMNETGECGQKKKMLLYPKPDRAYTLNFCADADRGKIDAATHPYALGGPMYSELVIESCLSIAEQKANDELGAHTEKFQQMLASMISRDGKSGAQAFGHVGDPDGFNW